MKISKSNIVISILTVITILSVILAVFSFQSERNAYKKIKTTNAEEYQLHQQLAINQKARAHEFDILLTLSQTQAKSFDEASKKASWKTESELMYQLLHHKSIGKINATDQVKGK